MIYFINDGVLRKFSVKLLPSKNLHEIVGKINTWRNSVRNSMLNFIWGWWYEKLLDKFSKIFLEEFVEESLSIKEAFPSSCFLQSVCFCDIFGKIAFRIPLRIFLGIFEGNSYKILWRVFLKKTKRVSRRKHIEFSPTFLLMFEGKLKLGFENCSID